MTIIPLFLYDHIFFSLLLHFKYFKTGFFISLKTFIPEAKSVSELESITVDEVNEWRARMGEQMVNRNKVSISMKDVKGLDSSNIDKRVSKVIERSSEPAEVSSDSVNELDKKIEFVRSGETLESLDLTRPPNFMVVNYEGKERTYAFVPDYNDDVHREPAQPKIMRKRFGKTTLKKLSDYSVPQSSASWADMDDDSEVEEGLAGGSVTPAPPSHKNTIKRKVKSKDLVPERAVAGSLPCKLANSKYVVEVLYENMCYIGAGIPVKNGVLTVNHVGTENAKVVRVGNIAYKVKNRVVITHPIENLIYLETGQHSFKQITDKLVATFTEGEIAIIKNNSTFTSGKGHTEGNKIVYDASTIGGDSGSPVWHGDKVVALHRGYTTHNEGIVLSKLPILNF
jgi:hypothetical protein